MIDAATPEMEWPTAPFQVTSDLKAVAFAWVAYTGYRTHGWVPQEQRDAEEREILAHMHDILHDVGETEWADVIGWTFLTSPFQVAGTPD